MSEQPTKPIAPMKVPLATPMAMGSNLASPLVIMVSQQDQQWIDAVHHRSYLLSIERGHLRYN